MTAGVSASLKVQCAMTSFSCHILLDQSVTIFQNSFLYPLRLIRFLVSLHEFRCSVVCVIFRAFVSTSLYLFHLHYSLFVTFVFCTFDSTMIQPYFSPQFLRTMFSFVLVRVKRSSLQCSSTFLCVLRSPLTQQFSLAVTM